MPKTWDYLVYYYTGNENEVRLLKEMHEEHAMELIQAIQSQNEDVSLVVRIDNDIRSTQVIQYMMNLDGVWINA